MQCKRIPGILRDHPALSYVEFRSSQLLWHRSWAKLRQNSMIMYCGIICFGIEIGKYSTILIHLNSPLDSRCIHEFTMISMSYHGMENMHQINVQESQLLMFSFGLSLSRENNLSKLILVVSNHWYNHGSVLFPLKSDRCAHDSSSWHHFDWKTEYCWCISSQKVIGGRFR